MTLKKTLILGLILASVSVGGTFAGNYAFSSSSVIKADSQNGYVNGKFYKNGQLANGYLNDGTNWFMFKSGVKQSQIQTWMGHYYYFDPVTYLRVNNAFRTEWGNTYYFNSEGIAVSGIQKINGKSYYFGDNGTYYVRKSTALTISGKQYLAGSDGAFLTGVQKVNDQYKYFDPNTGELVLKRDYIQSQWGSWYLIDKGIVQSGLQSWAGHTYYFDPVTYLKVTNKTLTINGSVWYFDNNGIGTQKSNPNPSSNDATFIALNNLRQAHGLKALVWDNNLASKATARAVQTNANGIPADHWHTAGEVIGIGWKHGQDVINAWYNETNMLPVGTTGHRDWELNPKATKVGIGYSGNVTVGETN